jgi:oligopeptidase B
MNMRKNELNERKVKTMLKRQQFLCWAFLLIVALSAVHCLGQVEVAPPVARIEPKVDTLFGQERVDNYYWLRQRDNPEVIGYLKAENAYTEGVMKHTEKLQQSLYEEMVARIKETDLSVPIKRDDYYYYYRTEKGKQYRIHCRKKGSLDAQEEILLDVNQLAEGKDYTYLGVYEVSPDHKLLAYATDTTGSERYTLRVKDLETGKLLPDVIDSVATSFQWTNDNKTFFYTIPDEAWRPFKLYRHVLGDHVKNDVLIYHEPDDAFFLSVRKSKSMKYLFIYLGSMTTTEIHYLNADNPAGEFELVHPRQQDMEYRMTHHDNHFLIVTNDNAKNFKLMQAPVSNPSKENWKELVPHRKSVKLDGIEVFQDFLVLYERENGLKQITIKDFSTDQTHRVKFPEPVYTFWSEYNPEYSSQLLRFNYSSFVTPRSVFDYNMKTRDRELKKQDEILGGYDPDQYQSEQTFAVAEDGTRIPISMVYKKGLVKDGNNPLYLYAYGAYGASSEPYFSSNRVSLLDRGLVFAIAHVRGGGEMGRFWYDDGKLLHKKNTLTDFIASAEHLIAENYTSAEKLVISGVSAGGLLIGSVVNMRPDLFKVVIADVPFVDLINTMRDPSIPLTVIEYEEWGNPNKKEYFDYMLSYSPYDNVEAKEYPNMLILAGLNDTRVQYWEPTKWTAKLRARKTDDNRLLLKTNMGTGHGGASGRYERIKEMAFEYAFILDVLGMTE